MKRSTGDEMFRPTRSFSRVLEGDVVRVGTQNPAKLRAVDEAFGAFTPTTCELAIVPVDVRSGVAEQPIGWDEIVRGARNRARGAFESGTCALAIGIEDGLVRLADQPSDGTGSSLADVSAVYNVGCAWLTDGEREGHGFSSAFAYPAECLEPAMRDRAPIGDLFDALWRAHRMPGSEPAKSAASGRQGGNIGLLTQGRLDRSAYGAQAVICGLVRFLHTDLYD
jgi:inosine/xanthosine triphosphatase